MCVSVSLSLSIFKKKTCLTYIHICVHINLTLLLHHYGKKHDQSSRVYAGHIFCTSKTRSQHMFDFNHRWKSSSSLSQTIPIKCWLVVYLPLWKIWLRQLGLLFPIYGKSFQIPWFQSPPTSSNELPFTHENHGDFSLRKRLPGRVYLVKNITTDGDPYGDPYGIQGSVSSPLPPSYRLQPRRWMFFLVNSG